MVIFERLFEFNVCMETTDVIYVNNVLRIPNCKKINKYLNNLIRGLKGFRQITNFTYS